VCPCGSKANWEILADTNNIADAFLHADTQAPQPIHVADSNASSAIRLGIGMALAYGTPQVFKFTYPPACLLRSNAVRSTSKSFKTGNVEYSQGTITKVCHS